LKKYINGIRKNVQNFRTKSAIPVFYRVRAIPFARNMQFVKRQYIILYKSRCIISEIASKIKPLHTNSKYVFWFKVSTDLVNLDQYIIFGIVYIPPENTILYKSRCIISVIF
jgi:hypothetical protein